MYGEDADLSLRARALGHRPAITPDAVITHEVGVSSSSRPDKIVLLLRGKVTLVRKHWSPVRSRIGVALIVLGVGVRALFGALGRLAGRLGRARELGQGLWPRRPAGAQRRRRTRGRGQVSPRRTPAYAGRPTG